jgi:hypothetical protein
MNNKYVTRKAFPLGGSKAVRLPADWLNIQGKGNFELTMVYNDDMLVMVSCGRVDLIQKLLDKVGK